MSLKTNSSGWGKAVSAAVNASDVPVLNEAAIVSTTLAAGVALPLHSLKLTGSTPLTELGSSVVSTAVTGSVLKLPASDMAGGFVLGPSGNLLGAANESTTGATHTWSWWFKWLVWGAASGSQNVWTHGDNADSFSLRSFEIGITSAGAITLRRFVAGAVASATSSLTIPNDNAWHHCACSYASGTQAFYLDGVLDGAPTGATMAGTLNTGNTRPIYLGAIRSGINVNLGPLAHATYWQEVISSAAIASIYAARL